MGLPKEAQNLVILIFAAQTNRGFYRNGVPFDPPLASLPDDLELKEQSLPSAAHWEAAVARAESIFGVPVSPLLKATNVATLSDEVKKKAEAARAACESYARRLKERLDLQGIPSAETDRMRTAVATLGLVERLHAGKPEETVPVLATAEVATTETAMGECLRLAGALAATLESTNWELFETIGSLSDERARDAQAVQEEVKAALRSDEHALALAPALKLLQSRALRLLRQAVEQKQQPAPPPVSQPVTQRQPGTRVLQQGSREDLDLAAARAVLATLEAEERSGHRVRITLNWSVEEGGTRS
jgi:hypothetical protein